MKDKKINWWATPPESPDLNPIENIWANMKHFLRTEIKPRTKDQLLMGIQKFWEGLTPETCTKFINHLKKVIPAVIENDGKASGF